MLLKLNEFVTLFCLQAGKKNDQELLEQAKRRREIVDLVWKHIEECESLEKKRFIDKTSGDRMLLLASGATGGRQGMFNEGYDGTFMVA